MKIGIIGGGAAGFFAAISCKHHHPDYDVVIFEKTSKLLSKVKVSGGGRCNVTHACFDISKLVKAYPRGARHLKKAFRQFSTTETVEWFESKGVKLKVEPDNRMFPSTDSSQTIIDCLLKEAHNLGVKVEKQCPVAAISALDSGFEIDISGKKQYLNKVIITSGGNPKLSGFQWIEDLNHSIESPIPSLFTFNMPNTHITRLMGVVADNASVRIQSTKLKFDGPVLITHWGLSGPAVLKLSAWGARFLHDVNYDFAVQVNWINIQSDEEVRATIQKIVKESGRKKLANQKPYAIPNRLWEYLLRKSELDSDKCWQDIGKKSTNKLISVLINDIYRVKGKTTFREEFVTCGGVSLQDVNFDTMQSRKVPGLYFAGEVLDIDGITGGFNFQAAWTTGFIAGKLN